MIAHRLGPVRLTLLVAGLLVPAGAAHAFDVVLNAQGEYLDAYLVNGQPNPPRVVFIDPDPPEPDNPAGPPARVGRHVNGHLCFFPKGFGHNGQFVIADDTYREACRDRRAGPQARCSITKKGDPQYVGQDLDGWGVFRKSGKWARRVIHIAGDFVEPEPQGAIDPQGCAFDAKGNFWGNDVGHGSSSTPDGSLVVFFRHGGYKRYCFLDKQLSAPGQIVMDPLGNIYVPETASARVLKFSPPFPTREADCANPEHLVTTPPTKTTFIVGAGFPSGIVRLPTGNFYIGSVVFPPQVNEFDASGLLVRNIVPARVPANPIGMDVGADGTLYYAELNLDPVTLGTRCGRMQQVRFVGGDPQLPELLGQHLRFPDGVTVADSSRFGVDFSSLPPSPDVDPSRCGGE
jgi:hypothetical protein